MDGIMNPAVLAIFIPTFFFVSITPGMCMTLALTMGMSIGLRRTLWMMLGELIGVGLVAGASVLGVAAILLQYPALFDLLRLGGGAYLAYIGVQMWRSKGRTALSASGATHDVTAIELALQGFVTAISNPKGWAFFIALLPPFVDPNYRMVPQLAVLLCIILLIEFCCLLMYAAGGKTLSRFLQRSSNIRLMNCVAGSLMVGVAVWLAFG